MVTRFLDWLFQCRHRRFSFPQSPQHKPEAAKITGCYVVCLECGKEFGYDWKEMRIEE